MNIIKLHKSQSGFSHIALVLILVVLAGVGFAGWKVYDARKSTSPPTANNATSTPKQDQPTIPDGFIEYENKELGFKFNYPKAWGVANYSVHARSSEIDEPVKTHFLNFSAQKYVQIKISPKNWTFNAQKDADYPIDFANYRKIYVLGDGKDITKLEVKDQDSTLALIIFDGFDGSLEILGLKSLKLSNINAQTIEVHQTIDENAAKDSSNPYSYKCVDKNTGIAARTCFSEAQIKDFTTVTNSISLL